MSKTFAFMTGAMFLSLSFLLTVASAQTDRKDLAFKGYELYSWRSQEGEWLYALVEGTNRTKSWDEISSAAIREPELKASLKRLAAGEQVFWCNTLLNSPPTRLEMPPEPTVRAMVDESRDRQVVVEVCKATSRSYLIPPGAVGFAYVSQWASDFYEVQIIFPEEVFDEGESHVRLESNDTVELRGKVALFDSSGKRASVDARQSARLEFWCENDGGAHYRPSFTVRIPRKEFSGTAKISTAESHDLFAVLTSSKPVPSITAPLVLHEKEDGDGDADEITRKLIREGRLSAKGPVVARVVEVDYKYSAGCGPELADPSLILETAHGRADLRCCGP